jgi:D-glycerate 3-kinase
MSSRRAAGYSRELVQDLLDRVLARFSARRRPWLVGLSGLQGSGKTTLARQLTAAARRCGFPALTLALDDFYLGREQRRILAANVHPELATRGPPGTHDVELLRATLALLRERPFPGRVRVPRFDKAQDERVARSRWRTISAQPALVVVEGWLIGVPPQPAVRLAEPVNAWERRVDRDARLRRFINRTLQMRYAPLWRELDLLVALMAPNFATARRWRAQAERKLRADPDASRAMDAAALARFMPRFERLSRQAQITLPRLADIAIVLDEEHRVRAISEHG